MKAKGTQKKAHGREHTIAKAARDGMPARRKQTATETPAPEATTHTATETPVPETTTQAAITAPDATTPDDTQELVVFAFRLSRAERDLIHAAAGSAKASKFVRGLAVAAARGDRDEVLGILDEVQAKP